jgi:hypothetical protein
MKPGRTVLGFIHSEYHSAPPAHWGELTITPVARSVRIDFPARSGGIIWNRPVGVSTSRPGEGLYWQPIVDLTRRAQLVIWAAVGVILMVAWLFTHKRRSE